MIAAAVILVLVFLYVRTDGPVDEYKIKGVDYNAPHTKN